jgi:hypothetical protein
MEAKEALHKQQLTEMEALALTHGQRAAQLERELQSKAKRCRELEAVVAQMKDAQQGHLAQIGRMQGAQVGFERRGFELEAAKSRIAELESSLRESTAVAERRRLELEASQLARRQDESLMQDITSSLQLREEELQAAQQERTLATQVLTASQLREQESCRQLAQLQQQVEASGRSSAEIEGVLRAAQAREARLAQLEGAISAAASASPTPRPAQAHSPRLPKDESAPHLLECGGPNGVPSAAAWSPAPSARPLHSGMSSPEISQLQPQAPSSYIAAQTESGGSSAPAVPPPSAPRLPEPRRPSATQAHSAPHLPAQPRPRQCRSPHAHKVPSTGFGSGGGSWESEGLNSLIGGVALALQRVSSSRPRGAADAALPARAHARSLSPMPLAA